MKQKIYWLYRGQYSDNLVEKINQDYQSSFVESGDFSTFFQSVQEDEVIVVLDQSIDFSEIRHQLNGLRSKKTAQVILNYNSSGFTHVAEIINSKLVDQVIHVDDNSSRLKESLKRAQSQNLFEQNQRNILQSVKSQNIELEKLKGGLEKVVYERTLDQEKKKKSLEEKVKKMRALNRFIKDLASARDVEELMELLRLEIKKFHKIKNPILVYFQESVGYRIVYFNKNNVFQKHLDSTELVHHSLGSNPANDRLVLANTFGRPIGKIVSVPLISLSRQSPENYNSVLFFEHLLNSEEVSEFVDMVSERLQSLSISLQRIILDQELRLTSYMWENTFNGISDPIAIINKNFKVLRANKPFKSSEGLLKEMSFCHEILSSSSKICEGCPIVEFERNGQSEIRSQIKVGEKLYEVNSFPIESRDSNEIEFVNHYLDITEEKKLYSKILQNEKMVAIGQLAGNIAHELNNPLTGIKSISQLLKAEAEEGSSIYKDLVEIEKASIRCHNIINNLLDFSKEKPLSLERVDLNKIVQKTLPLLKSATSGFYRNYNFSPDELIVEVDIQLLQQVIFNLVNNACQAMGESGELSIISLKSENKAVLEVRDNGPGISKEIIDKVFDPFFTTKKQGEGTGLGLSLSKSIVESFGGRLVLDQAFVDGARFLLELPLKKDET